MEVYTPAVIVSVLVTSLLLILVLRKNKLLNATVVISIAASSILVSLLFPVIFKSVSGISLFTDAASRLIAAFAATFFIYIVLIVACTVIVSSLLSNKSLREKTEEKLRKVWRKKDQKQNSEAPVGSDSSTSPGPEAELSNQGDIQEKPEQSYGQEIPCWEYGEKEQHPAFEDEKLYRDGVGIQWEWESRTGEEFVTTKENHLADAEKRADGEELKTSEKLHVLEEQGEDKPLSDVGNDSQVSVELPGLEETAEKPKMQPAEELPVEMDPQPGSVGEHAADKGLLTLEEAASGTGESDKKSTDLNRYIDKAFSLKKAGKYEEAVSCYMTALDLMPDNDMVFMIILDVCAIYKNLGKADLARLILESYAEEYGDIMDESIRNEIKKNLMYT